jgi:L-alanine-DL-glutamate epimerase-like enolase superfamily enzyme
MDLTASLRRAAPVPVGAGDEALPLEILGLIAADAVDVLRLDVTTVGGITGFAALRARIGAPDRGISTHVYPEIHQHLALAWPDVRVIETFARGGLFDSADRFVSHSSLRYENGVVTPPEGHGLGLEIDWDVVARHADRHFRLPA